MTMFFVWGLIPLLVVSCFVFVCRSYQKIMIRKLEVMQGEKLRLEAERDELNRSIASLSSRKRIYRYATEELGMRYPEKDEIVLIVFEEDAVNSEEKGVSDVSDLAASYGVVRKDRSPINVLTHFFALDVF